LPQPADRAGIGAERTAQGAVEIAGGIGKIACGGKAEGFVAADQHRASG
jgi:hypothetical protein